MICTVIFCLVFTAPAKWRVELRAKIGQYRYRCFACPHQSLLYTPVSGMEGGRWEKKNYLRHSHTFSGDPPRSRIEPGSSV